MKRAIGRRIAAVLVAVVASGAATVACSTSPPKTYDGLELIVATDGLKARLDFDLIRLEISEETDGGWNKLWDNEYLVPSQEANLPAAFTLLAGESAREVLIEVTAFQAGQPVVERVAQVQVPTDRLADLWLILAKICQGKVTLSGAEGEPQPACMPGESCQPTGPSAGQCATNVIQTSTLPTYVPGEALDAEPGLAEAGPTLLAEAGGATAADAASPATNLDAAGGADESTGNRDASSTQNPGSDADLGPVQSGVTTMSTADSAATPDSSGSSPAHDSGSHADATSPDSSAVTLFRDSGSDDAPGTDSGNTAPMSCQTGSDGVTNCGAARESCCTSLEVPGGMFSRTYTNTGSGPTGEADPATISAFRLDKYDVTVGRFRQFVSAWNGGAGWSPLAGSGKHTHLNGGKGLANSGSAGTFESGWVAADDGNVAPTDTNLSDATCDSTSAHAYATWTSAVGANEKLPINCVNWYEAYAFCIWDGGFLPSYAEWEFSAAGGNQQREYPWGSTDPGTANQYAIYNCDYPSGSGTCTGVASIAPVGFATLGAGAWGQLDLGGEVWQWNLDYNAPYVDPCSDCAYLTMTSTGYREVQGGIFSGTSTAGMMPYNRYENGTTTRLNNTGFRCARTP